MWINKSAALIPAANDDYSLSLSVPAIAPHVDKVIVYVDAHEDKSIEVLHSLFETYPNVSIVYGYKPIGWVDARNKLVELTDYRHLYFLDADDIFYDNKKDMLRRLERSDVGCACLGLIEAVGDFRHGTGRGFWTPHYDKCHCYIDRSMTPVTWRSSSSYSYPITSVPRIRTNEVLFVHAKRVKSDWRLRWRNGVRNWLKKGQSIAVEDNPEELHQHVINMLLNDSENRLKVFPANIKLPAICQHGKRFEMVYKNGVPVDRIDNGWDL